MRNCKKELLTSLVSALKTAMPTMIVRTKLNDFDLSDNTAYPYVYISDVYQSQDGPKNWYRYPVELLLQVVYKDATGLTDLYTTQNTVLGLFTKPETLTLTNNFTVMNTELLSNNDTEIKIDSGTLNIALIRLRFTIEDKSS